MTKTNREKILILCEAALMVAASFVLSFMEIPLGVAFGGFGGSISFVMVPLLVLAIRRGGALGLLAGLVFGTVKFLSTGAAVNWQSILLDYAFAYMAVGAAGFVSRLVGKKGLLLSVFGGCFARFLVHYLSGVTVYAMYMPEEFLGLTMTTPIFYSLLYNGTYMLPNTLLCLVTMGALAKPLEKFLFPGKK